MGVLTALALAAGALLLYPRGKPLGLAFLRGAGALLLGLLGFNPTLWRVSQAPKIVALIDTSASMDGAEPPDLPLGKVLFGREPVFPPADAYVLWSDGLWSLGELPEAPVYPMLPQKPPGKGVRIRSVVGPRRLSVGQETAVSIWAEALGEFAGTLRVWVNDSLAEEKPVSFSGLKRFRFTFTSQEEGEVRLRVELGKERSLWKAWASELGLRLNLVAWRPSPAVGAARRALSGVPGVRLKSFVLVGGKWLELAGDTVKKGRAPSFDADGLILVDPPSRFKASVPSFRLLSGFQAGGVLKAGPGSPFPDSLLKELPPLERVPRLSGRELILAGRYPALVETPQGLDGALELWRANLASGGELFKRALSVFVDKVRSQQARLWVWTEPPEPQGSYWLWAETDAPDGWVQVNGKPAERQAPGLFSAGPFEGKRRFKVELVREGKVVKSRVFEVEPKPRPEEPTPFVDTLKLKELAEATGGKVIKGIDELNLGGKAIPVRAAQIPWLALLGFGALLAEWGLRRWRGLS